MEASGISNFKVDNFTVGSNEIDQATKDLSEIKGSDATIKKMNIPGRFLNKLSFGKYEKSKNKNNDTYNKLTAVKASISGTKQNVKGLLSARRLLQKQLNKSKSQEETSKLNKSIDDLDRGLDMLEDSLGKLEKQLSSLETTQGKNTHVAKKMRADVISLGKKFTRHHQVSPGHVKYEILQTANKIKKIEMSNNLAQAFPAERKSSESDQLTELQKNLEDFKELDQQGVKRLSDEKLEESTEKLEESTEKLEESITALAEGKPVVSDASAFKYTAGTNGGEMCKHNYPNRSLIKQSLVSSVPPITLSVAASSSQAQPEAFDFNCYGLEASEVIGDPPINSRTNKKPQMVDDKEWYLNPADAQSADKVGSGQVGGVTFWTVADGSGNEESGRKAAENAVKGSNGEMENRLASKPPSTLREAAQLLVDSLDKAQKSVEEDPVEGEVGRATVAQSMVVGGYLLTLQSGDTSCFVLRLKEDGGYESIPIAPLAEGHDAADPEGGVGSYPYSFEFYTGEPLPGYSTDLRSTRIGVMKLQEGDLVVSGSDGIGDNVSSQELAELAGNERTNPTDLGTKIHAKVREKVKPWLEASIKEGVSDRQIQLEIADAKKNNKETRYKGKPDHLGFMIYQHGLENS